MMGILKFSPFTKMRKGAEQGWSLVNTLVTVILTLVIGSVAVALIVSAQRGSSQFTDTVMTESELNNAMSTMTRSITTAENVIVADDNLLKVSTTENGKKADVTYFAWAPDKWNDVKPYVTGEYATGTALAQGDLPAFPAVVSATSVYSSDGKASGKPEVRVLVNGYIQESGNKLFTYFDSADDKLPTVILGDDTKAVERIQIHLKATVEGRDAPMELATSVVPRIAGDADRTGPDAQPVDEVPQAVTLTGTLPPRTQESTLKWNAVDGADAYVLYRGNALQESNPKMLATTTATTWKDSDDIRWGETYTYYVVATNYAGAGPSSNVVALTATPPAPVLEGSINSSQHNVITWEPSNGAIGYRILKDGNVWRTLNGHDSTTTTDTAVNPGETHTYKAVAFNGNGTGKGTTLGNGDSHWSNEVTLVTPVAPTLTGKTEKGDRILNWNQPPGGQAYELKRISPSGKSFGSQTGRTYTDKEALKGNTSFKYQVRAHNGYGWSGWSNIVDLNPIPAPVQPTVSDYTNGYDGKNLAKWSHATNNQATSYEFKRGSASWADIGLVTSKYDTSPGADSKNTYHLRACNYIGCSASRNDQGLQPPGTFTVKLASETARVGYSSTRSDTNKNLKKQSAKFSWNASSGADNYSYSGAGSNSSTTSRSFTTSNFIPGKQYTAKVVAQGNTSGLSRTATTNWQAAPAQPNNIRYRMQYKGASNGDTRFSFWASKYGPVTGTADRVEIRHGVVTRGSSEKWTFSRDSTEAFDTWTSTKYTSAFTKKDTKPSYHKGGIAYTRSYKSKPSGYAGEVYSRDTNADGYYDSTDGSGWSTLGDNDKMHRGYIGLYGGTSVANPNSWQSSSGSAAGSVSSWTNVTYTPANYPANAESGHERNWYEVISR